MAKPAITSLSTATWKEGQTGIEINGVNFGATQGSGIVKLSVQGKDQGDVISANQTVTAWGDTQITVTAVLPQNSGVDWPGYFDLTVTEDGGAVSVSTQILIGPVQTTVAAQHASGLVELPDSGNPQTIIDAETARVSYLLTGNHLERTITLAFDGDVVIAAPGASMDGSKDITSGWTASGSNWKKTGQTQSDGQEGGAVIRSPWNVANKKQAEFFIGLAAQDQSTLCRIRRYNSTTNVAAADSTGSLTNPIATTKGSKLVWVTDAAHGLLTGECIRLKDTSAVGGITVAGFYPVLEYEAGRYQVEHEVAATSDDTGGGTVATTYGIGVYFDAGANEVYINIDATEAGLSIRGSTTASAFIVASGIDNCVIRGADNDNKLEILRYADLNKRGAIMNAASTNPNGWSFQFLEIHHCHGAAMKVAGNDWNVWDCDFHHHGMMGFEGNQRTSAGAASDSPVFRRIVCRYINMAHYDNNYAGGFKIKDMTNIDMDQMVIGYNAGSGAWFDSDCTIGAGGVRRLDCFNNRDIGFFYEINKQTGAAGHAVFSNMLVRDGAWDWEAGNYQFVAGAQVHLMGGKGNATHRIRLIDSVIEMTDHPDNGPISGVGIRTDTRSSNSEWNEVSGCRIVSKGTTQGVGRMCGFESKSGVSSTETTNMLANAIVNNNEYHHSGPDTDDSFCSTTSGSNNFLRTKAEWQSAGWDAASTFTFDDSDPPVSPWPKGRMPDWADVKTAGVSGGAAAMLRGF